MRYTIRWRFLLKLVVILVAAGAAVHFVHARQVKKQAGAFLGQADVARDAGEPDREADFLHRYLIAVPDDHGARDRFARLMTGRARTGKQLLEAHLVLEDALRRDPDRDDLRRFTVDFLGDPRFQAMGSPMYKEAGGHAQQLLARRPGDGALEAVVARSLLHDGKYQEAADRYATAIGHQPDLVESYRQRADILRARLNQAEDANQVIDEMVRKNPRRPAALLAWANYWRPLDPAGKAREIEAKVDDALRIARDEVKKDEKKVVPLDVLLEAAELARVRALKLAREGSPNEAKGEAAKARELLAECVRSHPKAYQGYLALALTEPAAEGLKRLRQGLEAVPDSVELALVLFDFQVLLGDAPGAAETLEKLLKPKLLPSAHEYARCRILTVQGKWQEAAPALAQVIPNLDPSFKRAANLLLAGCYEKLGHQERRLDALVAAAPDRMDPSDPARAAALKAMGDALTALGRTGEALDVYKKLATQTPGAWILVARLELALALGSPPDKRDWAPAARAVEEAEKALEAAVKQKLVTDVAEVRILRANLTHHRGDPAEARALLEKLKADRPQEVAVWAELATQYAREGDVPRGLATLDAAEKEVKDSPAVRLALRVARARLLGDQYLEARRKGDAAGAGQAAGKIVALADGAEALGEAGRRQLLRSLAEVATRVGAAAEAERIWGLLGGAQSDDLNVLTAQFDQYSRKGDLAGMEKALAGIRALDGEDGRSTRLATAALKIHQSRADAGRGKALRDEALALLAKAEEGARPPLLGRILITQAMAHELNKDVALALKKYKEADAAGEASATPALRTMELHFAAGEYPKVLDEYDRLPPGVKGDARVLRLVADALIRTGKPKEALPLATKLVPETSDNAYDLRWLGRVYFLAEDKAKTEVLYRKAADLNPKAGEGWLHLVQYYLDTGRKDQAEKVLEEGKGKMDPAARSLFAAVGHTQLGQADKAVEAYKKAREEKPNDPGVLAAGGEYLLQLGRTAEAQEWFGEAAKVAPEADRPAVLIRLALAYALSPDYALQQKAVKLLEEIKRLTRNETQAQRRVTAVILGLQKERDKKLEAIRLLEDNPDGRTANEQFLLVRLYAAVGDRSRSRVVLANLLDDPKNWLPTYVAYQAQALLREGGDRNLEKAGDWVDRLAKADPESLGTAVFKARLAAARKDPGEAARVLEVWEKKEKGAPLDVLARVYEELGLQLERQGDAAGAGRFFKDAERVIDRLIEEHRKAQPQLVLARAMFLGRRNRTAEALKVCEEFKPPAPMPVAVGGVGVYVLYNAKAPTAEELGKVAGWLEKWAADAKDPKEASARGVLRQQLASVRNLEGKFGQAADLYREAIRANPKDVVALNNLAYLISADPALKKHDEALGLVRQAKEATGPNPDFLDTEAMILVNKGDPAAAVKIMEGVAVEAPTGTALFHLAQAQLGVKEEGKARDSWHRAVTEFNLRAADLHPLERGAYAEMAKRFP